MKSSIGFRLVTAIGVFAALSLAGHAFGQTNEGAGINSLPPVPHEVSNGKLKWVRMGDVNFNDYVLVAPGHSSETTNLPFGRERAASNGTSRATPAGSSTNIWVAIGQTQQETIKRCGDPSYWGKRDSSNTAQAVYFQTEPHFWITFFTDKEGKSIAGQISYQLPQELARNRTLAEPVILRLLEVHTDGRPWAEDATSERAKRLRRTYRREGATAAWMAGTLTVSLNEYTEFAETEQKRRAAEQAERIGGSVKK